MCAANEAGETPLDIARRLKHLQCEELVSLSSQYLELFMGKIVLRNCTDVTDRCCRQSKINNHLITLQKLRIAVNYILYLFAVCSVHSWTRHWLASLMHMCTWNMSGGYSMKIWTKVMKIWMKRYLNTHEICREWVGGLLQSLNEWCVLFTDVTVVKLIFDAHFNYWSMLF